MANKSTATPAPVSGGLALTDEPMEVSGAAASIRAESIVANLGNFELASPFPPVDQGDQPCCVSCAIGAAMEILHGGTPLAPLFHYHLCRFIDGGANTDGELFLENALPTLTVSGICLKSLHSAPFTASGIQAAPSSEAVEDALTRALGRRAGRLRYEEGGGLSNAVWIREQLREGRPVLIGFRLPDDYPDTFLDQRFEWRHPEAPAPGSRGHCVLATGYNELRQAIHVRDSRGPGRFEQGSWWMGNRVIDSPVVQQLYSIIP